MSANHTSLTGTKLDHAFYQRQAIDVARELLGTILVRRVGRKMYRARIVETEAYVGPHDLACHASKGRTKRTEVMFGAGGHAYVYFIYGMHEMFNIVTGIPDDPQAVLIRGAEPLDGWQVNLSGPGRFTKGLQIDRSHNGLDLTGKTLFLTTDPAYRPKVVETKRIGVDYAADWKDAMLRFIDIQSPLFAKRSAAEAIRNSTGRRKSG